MKGIHISKLSSGYYLISNTKNIKDIVILIDDIS